MTNFDLTWTLIGIALSVPIGSLVKGRLERARRMAKEAAALLSMAILLVLFLAGRALDGAFNAGLPADLAAQFMQAWAGQQVTYRILFPNSTIEALEATGRGK